MKTKTKKSRQPSFLEKQPITVSATKVVRKVSDRTGVTPTRICGPTRPAEVALARQMCYWMLRMQGWDYAAIGRFFNRDHGAVMYGCQCVNIRFDLEPQFRVFWKEYSELRVAGPQYSPAVEIG